MTRTRILRSIAAFVVGTLFCLTDVAQAERPAFTAHAALPATADRAAVEVDIVLERFSVTTPKTRFVIGSQGGDRAFDFDHAGVLTYRGSVAGIPGSHVFLSGREGDLSGRLEFRDGTTGFALRSDGAGSFIGSPLPASNSLPPGVALCGVPDGDQELSAGIAADASAEQPRVIELAVETDYELFVIFDDLQATGDFIVELYAASSDVFMRDVNVRFELTFVRLWDDPADLFNEPSPLAPFRTYWNENMDHVPRAIAQLCSGRRDFSFGGQAYLNALCGDFGYSVVGYIGGVVAEEAEFGVLNYDLRVTAHEIGHNAGASHTHSYDLDDCQTIDGPARRGSIMSYCSQTRSGGNANTDNRFHTVPQSFMRDHVNSVDCLYTDCNGNGQEDSDDIAGAASNDVNGNGIPDECEDCNGNGVLDPQDIANGTSTDEDFNGVPDDCQSDCNGNGVVDVLDILDGTSDDLYGNGVPDECETDCDGNGMSDYSQIQLDMSLDLNRDAILDGCQDCDGDGTTDIDARNGAHDIWIASHQGHAPPSRYHAQTGARHLTADAGHVVDGNDVCYGPDDSIYVSSSDHRVVRFDRHGGFIDDFVPAGSGGLAGPMGLVFGPDGNLYVASHDSDTIPRYDSNGASLGDFVPSGVSPMSGPTTVIFGGDGDLYAADDSNRIYRFNGTNGAYLGEFVSAGGNGGLTDPRGMAFTPDDRLLVTSHGTNQVLAYDAETGAFLGQFNDGGTEAALSLDSPWGVRMGVDGNVYVSRHDTSGDVNVHDDLETHLHLSATRVYLFDLELGYFMRSYVNGNDTGLHFPTGFVFLPGDGADCNVNGVPDACDIASGVSDDANGNGVPDECETVIDRTPLLRGDCTGDSIFNGLLDALFALEFQFLGGKEPVCLEACDADSDRVFNGLLDSLFMLAHQFQGGPTPAQPYPECGIDPEPENSLRCKPNACN